MRRRVFGRCSGSERLPQIDYGPLLSLEEQREEVAETRKRLGERLSKELG
jgi:hypothetical protein